MCWDSYRKRQIDALGQVYNTAAKFAHHRNYLIWDRPTLTQHRKISRICALFKAYTGEQAWKAIEDKFVRPSYLSRVDHERKLEAESQRQI
jgi:hypothetical protein